MVNPESATDITKIHEYSPCVVQKEISKPFTFNKSFVRFVIFIKIVLDISDGLD